jgi:DNA topoisomerase-3
MTDVAQNNVPGTPYVKNYVFDFNFGNQWGNCSVVCTSVAGHLVSQDFSPAYSNWNNIDPASLFRAEILKSIPDVGQPRT